MTPESAATDAKMQTEAGIEHWQQRCAELTAERDRLRQELADVNRNYAATRKALVKLMDVKVEFDEEELLAQLGKGQSLEEFIDELEAEYRAKGEL